MRISVEIASEIAEDLMEAAKALREFKGSHPLERACNDYCSCLACRLKIHAFTMDHLGEDDHP